jgi:hypothetical protein
MTINQPDVIDIISINKAGDVVLTISDHLDWSNSVEHQAILEAKLNKYLAFVESREILTNYPDAKGRRVLIKIVFKFEPDIAGLQFLSKAEAIVESAGFSLQHMVFG